MTTVKIIREFYGIRYSHAEFGARPDLTHPEMVKHPLSRNQYIVEEFDTPADAYIAAHARIGKILEDGPLKGRSMAGAGVEVFRAAEHEPVVKEMIPDPDGEWGGLWAEMVETVTMTITGSDLIPGIPHFTALPLSRYCPVNGWVVPETIDI